MSPERWQRIEELFRAVADRLPVERLAYLEQECGEDKALQREVLDLLAHETADDFLEDPIQQATIAVASESTDEMLGRRIGPYRLTRLIGRGGMGAVYEAVRDDQEFEQRVAVKLIRRGMDSDFVRSRFLRERQILAALDHPHIARLFDGGTTRDGLPYFVMEFVAGQPITDYCHERSLPLAAKLNLFRDVCAAVQHAHQNLVVHRDLKPSNILVTEDGTPKLLDFGIAKLLAPEASEALTRTGTSVRLMTPEYASPEQVRGGVITTATDVYALGVVLYELLTDRRPFQLETYVPQEVERAICESEAVRPSDVLEGMKNEGGGMKRRRFFSPLTSLIPQASVLRGDLDNIVMMALRKEAGRRYQSVEQFSEDLQRYLAGLPVSARKDTFRYRASKFARRHKVGVTALVGLVVLTFALAWLAWRIARERDRANQAAVTAEAVTQSLVTMYEFADPNRAGGNPITAKDLLDQGADRVVRELKDQPVVQAKLLSTIGSLYQSIGVYDRAQPLLEESVKLRRQTLGLNHPDVADSLHRLSEVLRQRGDLAASETALREALTIRRNAIGNQHLDTADTANELGALLVERGQWAEAESLLRESLALRRRRLGDWHTDVAASLNGLGRWSSEQGKLAEAAALYQESLLIRRKLFGSVHPQVATSLNNLAAMLEAQGNYREAEALYREALAIRLKLLGAEHPDYAASLANLASVLHYQKEFKEAESLYRQTLALRRKLLGPEHPRLAITLNNLGSLLRDQGQYAESETLLRQSIALRRKQLGDAHPEVATGISNLALLYAAQGQFAEAEKLQRQALEILNQKLKPDHWTIHRSRSHLGACLTSLKRYQEAETELLASYAGLKTAMGEKHELTRTTASRLVKLYEAWNKPEQAAAYR